ncbi:uncharacterized protein LOC111704157 [Eurytemora carolleeae]|uniref:uncharacterized protein LOC111704157 n=1 Tax=Eurytemora carolleeae TaxID=1294199 RepID=UPI000C75F5B5|nr:uncharacterized protein LOC111704157 [Eurytemora carolleeae]|eukprot:XP_023332068.1 uncharacterized protein LOC111704157 [Eurytemora affinis]
MRPRISPMLSLSLPLCCMLPLVSGTRCYIQPIPDKRFSVECGESSSCIKISQPPYLFNQYGEFLAPDRRPGFSTLFRGCFVIDMHMDLCFTSKDGLEYCWCSSKDLCNDATISRSFLHLFSALLLSIMFI